MMSQDKKNLNVNLIVMNRLKFWLSTAICLIALLVCMAFGAWLGHVLFHNGNYGPGDSRFNLQNVSEVSARIVMDRVTGVYYAIFESDGGLAATPLLMPDGTPERVDKADIAEVADDIQRNEEQWLKGQQ